MKGRLIGTFRSGCVTTASGVPGQPLVCYQGPRAAVLGRLRCDAGHVFGPTRSEGVFRPRDGGVGWEKVFYINDKTGAVDLAMDPGNSDVDLDKLSAVLEEVIPALSGMLKDAGPPQISIEP